MSNVKFAQFSGRRRVVLALLALAGSVLVLRALDLQVFQQDFLRGEGEARYLRTIEIPAHRGMILDRNGEPLAVSAPVDSVWVDPARLMQEPALIKDLARVLQMDARKLAKRIEERSTRRFYYIKRQVPPEIATQVEALKLPGVGLQREYRRFYPSGEISAQLLGFTNIDDDGQEGLELALNDKLRGEPGLKSVIKSRRRDLVEPVEQIKSAVPGQDVSLTIDRRLQYLAYRELKRAVQMHHAKGGAAVLVDAHTGDILAMVNQPSFNPNMRLSIPPGVTRNRAVTDTVEPGSTMKPITIAAALESGKFTPHSIIDTRPGWARIGRFVIHDHQNYGVLDVTGVMEHSSNVGTTKMALEVGAEPLWQLMSQMGFGEAVNVGFPGEVDGNLRHFSQWGRTGTATNSYGYGLSVTPLQLAAAYTVLADDGRKHALKLLRDDAARGDGEALIKPSTAQAVRKMMVKVVESGTGTHAHIQGYTVAGKTGTVHKAEQGGYADDRYVSLFAGMVPADKPRFVMVVTIDEPAGKEYYGGQVAAPVFAKVMEGALRLMDVAPDAVAKEQLIALRGGV